MAYGYFKILSRKIASDKILSDKVFIIAENLKYHEYQGVLASMVYKFFDEKKIGSGIKNKNMSDQLLSDLATRQLAKELQKPIIRKFKKRKVQSSFTDNIWLLILLIYN